MVRKYVCWRLVSSDLGVTRFTYPLFCADVAETWPMNTIQSFKNL